MSINLYFLKVNLNSHILQAYEDKSKLKEILRKLYVKINDNIEYSREDHRTVDGEEYEYDANYKFNLITKNPDYTLYGNVIKKSFFLCK